jgi:hypothetical protein
VEEAIGHPGDNIPENMSLLVLLQSSSPLGLSTMAASLEVRHDAIGIIGSN